MPLIVKLIISSANCLISDRKYDFENYLSTILLKSPLIRRNAFAIRAFNAELSQIRDITSTQVMAQIRLHYWSDLIDEIFANHSMVVDINQPIAYELQKVFKFLFVFILYIYLYYFSIKV